MICAKIKQALGIDGTAPEPTSSDYIFITSAAPTIDDLGLPTLNSWTLEEDKLPKPLTGVASIGSLYYGKSGQEAQKLHMLVIIILVHIVKAVIYTEILVLLLMMLHMHLQLVLHFRRLVVLFQNRL